MPSPSMIAIIVLVVILFVTYGIFMQFLGIWIRALMAGAKVDIWVLVGMKLRRVPPALIVDAYIKATKAGLGISTDQLEGHHLAGGNVLGVVDLIIKARHRDINVPFEIVATTDLAGYDLETVNPDEFAGSATQATGS